MTHQGMTHQIFARKIKKSGAKFSSHCMSNWFFAWFRSTNQHNAFCMWNCLMNMLTWQGQKTVNMKSFAKFVKWTRLHQGWILSSCLICQEIIITDKIIQSDSFSLKWLIQLWRHIVWLTGMIISCETSSSQRDSIDRFEVGSLSFLPFLPFLSFLPEWNESYYESYHYDSYLFFPFCPFLFSLFLFCCYRLLFVIFPILFSLFYQHLLLLRPRLFSFVHLLLYLDCDTADADQDL